MSFLTCFWDLPQKEHFSSSPPSPNLATVEIPLSVFQEPTAAIGAAASAADLVLITSSMMPYSLASAAVITKSRSVSLWIRSIGWPVCSARISSRSSRSRRISLAASSMSVAWPWAPA